MTSTSDQVFRKEIQCECGNIIRYEDIQMNLDYPAYKVLICKGCGRNHRTIIDGRLFNLSGAV